MHHQQKSAVTNKPQTKVSTSPDKRATPPPPKTESTRSGSDFFKKIIDRTKGFLVDDINDGKDY
jgi:hypothetical protein